LAITLPNFTNSISAESVAAISNQDQTLSSLSRKYRFTKIHTSDIIYKTNLSVQELAQDLQGANDWEYLGRALNLPDDDLRQIQREYFGQETLTVLRIWMEREGTKATIENLESAFYRLGREDIIKKRFSNLTSNILKEKRESTTANGDGPTHGSSDERESKKPRI